MFPPRRLLFVSLLAFSSIAGRGQAPDSDPQAVSVLQQALNVSGAAMNPVRSFTASGTITYFWAGNPVQGAARIRARGHDQFRLDADLPEGTRSVAINRQGGRRKGADGKLDEIPAHNTMSAGTVLTLPYASIAAVLEDPAATLSYLGLADLAGRPAHRVRVTKYFPSGSDPEGILRKLSRMDYFVDVQTGLVSKTEDVTHPVENLAEEYSREVELDGYTAINGVAVPTVVREKVAGQTTWEFRLSAIAFNGNLSDADFSLQ